MLFEVHIHSYHTFFNFGGRIGGNAGRDTMLRAEGNLTVVASLVVESLVRNAPVWPGPVARFGPVVLCTVRFVVGGEEGQMSTKPLYAEPR